MDVQNVLWFLLLTFQLQDGINGASLAKKYVPSSEKIDLQSDSQYKDLLQKRQPSQKILRNQMQINLVKNKWNVRQLQTQYDVNVDHSYRSPEGDTNPYDLKMNVDGFQVKVISSPKSRQHSTHQELKKGHVIEIVPNTITTTETVEDECEEETVLTETSSDDLNSKNGTNSDLMNSLQAFEDGSGESETKDNELSKSSRLIDVFFRSNNSETSCKTPTGEIGHCKSMTECLLSDALSNVSLFLQYLCLMRGPFVGMCCPDNPVIETKDTDNSTENTTQEFKQPEEGCGKNSNLRIVGGTLSLPHEWTWMVALLRRNRFFCGGVIINNWYILTAAHCVLGLKVKDLTVRLGEYNFSEKNEHQKDIPVAEIKRHAQFVTLTFQHDIALLKLKKKIEYSKFLGSICLPEPRNYTEVNATVVGWGTVSFGGAASPILRQVTLPVWSNKECDKTYVFESITDSFICAGSPGEDACQGDSGGPLMSLNKEKRWEVIGIVSWGRRCGDPIYPGVYTRVSTYLDWIQENIN